MLLLEVVGLMPTLLSLPLLDSIQVIITELDSTPLTVLTVQLITRGLPTIAPCMGPDGDMVTVGVGTVCRAIKLTTKAQNCSDYLPVTSSVILLLAITGGFVLITTSHWITLPSSVVFNCEIV